MPKAHIILTLKRLRIVHGNYVCRRRGSSVFFGCRVHFPFASATSRLDFASGLLPMKEPIGATNCPRELALRRSENESSATPSEPEISNAKKRFPGDFRWTRSGGCCPVFSVPRGGFDAGLSSGSADSGADCCGGAAASDGIAPCNSRPRPRARLA